MFIRMLKLPEAERATLRSVVSLRVAIHAAAPCPIPVKEQMIEWWGPMINEYYAGTEGNGFCAIDSEEWLAHKGSVGRALTGHAPHPRRGRQGAAAGEAGHDLLRGRQTRSSTTRTRRRRPRARRPQGWTHARRHRLPRRRRLPLPDRPQGAHDHLRRRQHLSAGVREPAGDASEGRRRAPCSAFPTRTSARR